jgi:hypothetical protein
VTRTRVIKVQSLGLVCVCVCVCVCVSIVGQLESRSESVGSLAVPRGWPERSQVEPERMSSRAPPARAGAGQAARGRERTSCGRT